MLVVSTIVKSPSMGEMKRKDFVDGWLRLNCDSLEKQKAHMIAALETLPTTLDLFTLVYKHTFQLGKAPGQKTVPYEQAVEYWRVLFRSSHSAVVWHTPAVPWLGWWLDFLTQRRTEAVNRDVWNETLKFARKSLEDGELGFWTEDSSWPSIIDEFVAYAKNRRAAEGGGGDPMEL